MLQAEPQAEEATSEEVQIENIVFSDEAVMNIVEEPSLLDPSFDEDRDSTAGLAKFLSRPVLIDTDTWTEGNLTLLQNYFNPWTKFFSDTKIQNKTKNYCRLHCKLHLKWVFNASPFYCGAIRVGWFPCRKFITLFTVPGCKVPMSQAPGVWLMPQEASSVEMVLPFLHSYNWINPLSISQLDSMGQMVYELYAPLASANAATGAAITISCYAWAEDVVLGGLTANETLQATPQKEEGKISGLASSVGRLANSLSSTPIVGAYASAVAVGAKVVGSLASAFGFSNAPITADVNPLQPKAFHAFANCETSMPVDRLCIDPKNEVTIDNRVAGVSTEDPLELTNFLRESYIDSIDWDNSQVTQTTLRTFAISPALDILETVPATASTRHYHTPMAYAARMFKLWRGSIIYRFKVIKTQYHKGRLRLSWDPFVDNTSNGDTETTTFTKILDLESDSEFEIEIPYKAQRIWCDTTFVPASSTDPYSGLSATSINGYLNMRVQNIITSPQVVSSVRILVFARPGPDFQFAQPQELPGGFSPWDIQATPEIDGTTGKTGAHLTEITTGEAIRSLRALVHRVSLSFAQLLGEPRPDGDATTTKKGLIHSINLLPRKPLWYGLVDTGLNFADAGGTNHKTANFCATHPIAWLLNAFVGYRGSFNIHVDLVGGSTTYGRRLESASLERFPDTILRRATADSANSRNRTSYALDTSAGSTLASKATYVTTPLGVVPFPSGQRGLTLTKEVTQSALSANIPQYANQRFATYYADLPHVELEPYAIGRWHDNVRLDTNYVFTSDYVMGEPEPTAFVYYSAGIDFQPVYFVCIPPLYTYAGALIPIDSRTPT